ncbi:DUF2608 domain-containing protein [Posidoniimonas polymericola]|uniref:DUF2608 domain-containing protein n=1 Tax=Posidoniimonas polymericola TaxID=2528002 RepID=UPI0011B4A16B|nr:DUF2608 domain-containing protein [Posidoniimonas polymericola]
MNLPRPTLLVLAIALLWSPWAAAEEPALAPAAEPPSSEQPAAEAGAAERPAGARIRKAVTTADFERVVKQVEKFAAKHTAAGVLLVMDIDNTLLAMNQDLGSDQWFNWQAQLQQDNPRSRDLVARDFPGLLGVQGELFALSGMHPPQPELPALIEQIQDLGVTTVVLTSRGHSFRDAAERELTRNGYDFSVSALRIDEARGLFLPFDANRPDAHGLSAEIIQQIEGRLAPVSYANGIYMTAGQHKGYMLQTLLARAIPDNGTLVESRAFRAVVFVDDHEKHTARVHEALADSPLDLATFRYSREDGNVARFNESAKRHVVEDWNRLHRAIDAVMVR